MIRCPKRFAKNGTNEPPRGKSRGILSVAFVQRRFFDRKFFIGKRRFNTGTVLKTSSPTTDFSHEKSDTVQLGCAVVHTVWFNSILLALLANSRGKPRGIKADFRIMLRYIVKIWKRKQFLQ